MSDKLTIRVTTEKRTEYHAAEVGLVERRLERFTSGDLQIMNAYLHANESPTIEGLAVYAKRCYARQGAAD